MADNKLNLAQLVKDVQDGTINKDEFNRIVLGGRVPEGPATNLAKGYGPVDAEHQPDPNSLGSKLERVLNNKYSMPGAMVGAGAAGATGGGILPILLGALGGSASTTPGDVAATGVAAGMPFPGGANGGRFAGAIKGMLAGGGTSIAAQEAKSVVDGNGLTMPSAAPTAAGAILGGLGGFATARPAAALTRPQEAAQNEVQTFLDHQNTVKALTHDQIAAKKSLADAGTDLRTAKSAYYDRDTTSGAKADLDATNKALLDAQRRAEGTAQGNFLTRQNQYAADIAAKQSALHDLKSEEYDTSNAFTTQQADMNAAAKDARDSVLGQLKSKLTENGINVKKSTEDFAVSDNDLKKHIADMQAKEDAAKASQIADLRDQAVQLQNRNTVIQKTGRDEKGRFMAESQRPAQLARNTVAARLLQNQTADLASGAAPPIFTHTSDDLKKLAGLKSSYNSSAQQLASDKDALDEVQQMHDNIKNGVVTPPGFEHPPDAQKKLADLAISAQQAREDRLNAEKDLLETKAAKAQHRVTGAVNNSGDDSRLIDAQQAAADREHAARMAVLDQKNRVALAEKNSTAVDKALADKKLEAPPTPKALINDPVYAKLLKAAGAMGGAIGIPGSGVLGKAGALASVLPGGASLPAQPPSALKKLLIDSLLKSLPGAQPLVTPAPLAAATGDPNTPQPQPPQQ